MAEKTKKILGLVFGIIAPGVLLGLFFPLVFAMGVGAYYVALLLLVLLPMILQKYFSIKFYFMGLAINVLGLAAGLLAFLGACAEHPFMGSAHPGAGTPFFIAAAVAGVFAAGLFIIMIKVLINSKDEPEKENVHSGIHEVWAE